MSGNDNTIIDLNFVPDWARQPAGLTIFKDLNKHPRARKHGMSENGHVQKTARRDKKSDFHGRQRAHAPLEREKKTPRTSHFVSGKPGSTDKQSSHVSERYHSGSSRLPVTISFLPERKVLKPIGKWLTQTGKAYSLIDIASMFLSKPEYFAVKLETVIPDKEGSSSVLLYQCVKCKAVFHQKENAVAHALDKHFNMFYEKKETQVDPPKGDFLCVAQCGLSGELMGPPNYHGYNDKMLELYKTRFSYMSLDEYRNQIVNKTDQALIDQWKQEATRQISYQTLGTDETLVFKHLSNVEKHFVEHYASDFIREGHRFIIPGVVSRSMDCRQLREMIHESWVKENRFPLKMSIAIHPAFRHLGLFIFKTPNKTSLVTSIHPNPIAPTQTTDVIRYILEYLDQHPGSNRHELVKHLKPDALPDSHDVGEIINALRWLIDKGHIIEFFNGTLAVPLRKVASAELRREPKTDDNLARPVRTGRVSQGARRMPDKG